jgi:hypothetical protein
MTPALDIFKRDVRGNPVWIDAVDDLEDAHLRLNQLASILPGEYFVYDHRTRRIVASVTRLDCDHGTGAQQWLQRQRFSVFLSC